MCHDVINTDFFQKLLFLEEDIIFSVSMVFLVKELEKNKINIVNFMRDLERQGHLTFPISGPNKVRAIGGASGCF